MSHVSFSKTFIYLCISTGDGCIDWFNFVSSLSRFLYEAGKPDCHIQTFKDFLFFNVFHLIFQSETVSFIVFSDT